MKSSILGLDELISSLICIGPVQEGQIRECKHAFDGFFLGYFELPKRHGKLKDLRKFDAGAFGVHPKQANTMDPQLRLLLEVSFEAICDAGR